MPGKVIRKLCYEPGIKQNKAVRKLGITQRAYSTLENSSTLKSGRIFSKLKALVVSNMK